MNMFSNLSTEGVEAAEDVVGGSKFEPVASDIYDATIKLAYGGEAASGAKRVTVVLDVNGTEVSEDIYVTNRQGETFYTQDGKRKELPGFTTINELCMLTTEEGLSAVNTENKVVNIYNFDERKELPTEVPMLIDLLAKPIKVAITREIVDKQKKGDDGKYHNTGETRVENVIKKFMHPETSRTVNEYIHEVTEPEYATSWLERFKGKDINRAKGAANGGTSGTGRPGASGSGQPAKKKLFG